VTVVNETAVNGRITAWVTLSAACQACYLTVTLVPNAAQLAAGDYRLFEASPVLYTVTSRQLTVLPYPPNATFAVMTTTVLPPSVLSIATPITLEFAARSNIGNYAIAVTDSVVITAYNTIATALPATSDTPANWWWYGNGGVLRPTTIANPYQHHTASFTTVGGVATVTAYFTKTCTLGCGVVVGYLTANGQYGTFRLRNADGGTVFTVRTAPAAALHVGFMPRFLRRGAPTSLSFWEVGSELPGSVDAAGVAHGSTAHLPATATSVVVDNTAGDGGLLDSQAFPLNATTTVRVEYALPCARCTLTVGPFTRTLLISTTATHLRPAFALDADARITGSTAAALSFNLRALDDDGVVDALFGQTSCDYVAPFFCVTGTDAATVTALMSADGRTPGGFYPTGTIMTAIGNASLTPIMGSNQIVNGRGQVSITLPAALRYGTPIFYSRGLTSALTDARQFAVPRIDIPAGTSGLQLVVSNVPSVVPVGVSIEIDVGMVSPISRVISSVGDNSIQVAAATNCPAFTVSPGSSFALQMGYRRIAMTFAALPPSAGGCVIGFTTASTSASQCAACAATVVFNVTQLAPTSWAFLRPTKFDNDGAPEGPLFAAAGRRQFVTVQLYASPYGRIGSCPGCVFTVGQTFKPGNTLYDACSFTATEGTFDAAGRSTIVITYAAHTAPYRCAIHMQVKNNDAFVPWDVDGLSLAFRDIEVCTPAAIRFTQNVTSLYQRKILQTAVPYAFDVAVVDQAGNVCRGDSMDDASSLTIETVSALDSSVSMLTQIPVVNTNATGTGAAAFASGNFSTAIPLGRAAQVVAGRFRFLAVFAASSYRLAALRDVGFRLRVTSPFNTLVSPRLDTVVAASVLRVSPSTPLPRFAVVGQKMITGPAFQSLMRYEAVDALPPEWVALGLVPTAPNIAMEAGEVGLTGNVRLLLDPRPEGVDAFAFAVGEGSTRPLTRGAANWTSLTWTYTPGEYRMSAYTDIASVDPASAQNIIIQRATALRVRDGTGALCSRGCSLPGFVTSVDTTTSVSLMSVSDVTVVNVTIAVVDDSGRIVEGDYRSVIKAELISDTRVTVKIARPPDYASEGPFYARVSGGVAVFTFGLLGSTASASSLSGDLLAALSFTCPATRPASTLLPGDEAPANPCVGVASADTRGIKLRSTALAAADFSSAAVLASRVTFKLSIPSRSTKPLREYRSFPADVIAALQRRNASSYRFLSAALAPRALPTTTCSVTPAFWPADLGSSVCRGTITPVCAFDASSVNCPPQVLACDCAVTAAQQALRASVLRRSLLQLTVNFTNSSGNATEVALEFAPDLQQAPGYRAATTYDVAADYRAIQSDIAAVLAADVQLKSTYGYNVSSIRTRLFTAAIVTAAPPAPTAPMTTAPTTAAPGIDTGFVSAATPRFGTDVIAVLALVVTVLVAVS
jgi:hypothetical protein